MKCCICLNHDRKKWFNAPCKHSWCRKCHRNMQRYDIITCPLCRKPWWTLLFDIYEQDCIKRRYKRERRASYQNFCF